MQNIFHFIFIGFSFLLSLNCSAFTVYLELSNGRHTIALIGMAHVSSEDPLYGLHERQAIEFEQFIASMNNQDFQANMHPKESVCYYEIDPGAVSEIKKNDSTNLIEYSNGFLIKKTHRGDVNNRILAKSAFDHPQTRVCRLTPADPRSIADELLAGNLLQFKQAIQEGNVEKLNTQYKELMKDAKARAAYHKQGHITVSEYKTLICSRIKQIVALRDLFSNESAEFKVFENILEILRENEKQVNVSLQNVKPNWFMIQVFGEQLKILSEKNEKLNLLENYYDQIYYGLASHFADAVFLEKILAERDAQKEFTVMVVGQAHVFKLAEHLISLGYNSSHYTESKYKTLENGSLAWDLCGLTALIYQRLKVLHGLSSSTVIPVPKSKTCSTCEKPETIEAPLLTCGGCKKAFYCNKECQKSNWKKHKLDCLNKSS